MKRKEGWDAVVVGGGPAGLSAALWLARYKRRVLVLDHDRPRNEAAWAVHGYPGLVDPKPEDLRRRLLEQAIGAGAIREQRKVEVVEGRKDSFEVRDDRGDSVAARRILLSYGRTDRLPELHGLLDFYGVSVFHCPDCDGPSVSGCQVGVLGHDRYAAGLALYLLTWVKRAVLLTNGLAADLNDEVRATLERSDVAIRPEPVTALEGKAGRLKRVRLGEGEEELDALFFHWGSDPATELARRTGCECEDDGDIRVDPRTMETTIPGVYAAGDIVGRPHLAISAAAEGVRSALSIHRSLLPAEFDL